VQVVRAGQTQNPICGELLEAESDTNKIKEHSENIWEVPLTELYFDGNRGQLP
jgi:hypothetical protein